MSRLLMIAEKVNDRTGRFLLAVHEDAVVAVRRQIEIIPTEPITMGIAALRFSKRKARREDLRSEIRTLPHELLRKRYPGTQIILFEETNTVELKRRGRKSVLRFNRRSGRRRQFTLTSDDEVNELSGHLQKILGSRFMNHAA